MPGHWDSPSHPSLLEVVRTPGNFASFSRSKVSLPPGALLARLESPPLIPATRSYATVQVSRSQNIDLESDFLFINHSCEPSLEFHVVNAHNGVVIEVRVAKRKDSAGHVIGLTEGDELTFFYPSTEWDMAQPFQCHCKSQSCKGEIRGAKHLGKGDLQGYFLNQHILELLAEREETELKN